MFLDNPSDIVAQSWAEPGDTRSFTEKLADTLAAPRRYLRDAQIAALPADQRAPYLKDAATASDFRTANAYADLVSASAEATRLAGLSSSHQQALSDAAQQRIDAVQKATGVQLENPFDGGYNVEAWQRVRDGMSAGETMPPPGQAAAQFRQKIFQEKFDAVLQQHPDKAAQLAFPMTLEQTAQGLATGAEQRAAAARQEFQAAGGSAVGGFITELAGSLWGSRNDPLTVGSLVIGPEAAVGRTVLARVAMSALAQGLTNVGLLALERPAVNDWRTQRGLASAGNLPSLAETGWAFMLGAIPGAVARGVVETRGLMALKRVFAGEPRPGDIEAAMRHLGAGDPEVAAALEAGAREIQAEGAARADTPVGDVPPAEAPSLYTDAKTQALRHAADPVDEPPAPAIPEIPTGTTDAAARAALKDIADPVAAVSALRADPALTLSALASDSPALQAAGRLATLSDEAFAKVADGTATPHAGLATAEATARADWHTEILDRVTRAQPADLREARLVAADATSALANGERTARARLEQTVAADDAATAQAPPPAAPPGDVRGERIVPVPDGTATLASPEAAALAGERQTLFADLIRSCK